MSIDEKNDLKILLQCFVAVPFIWLLFLGWTPNALILSQDVVMNLPWYQALHNVGGDWSQLLYSFDAIGGIKVADILGKLPILQLFSVLGLSVTWTLNLTVFCLQIGFAFLGTKAMTGLTKFFGTQEDQTHSWISQLGLVGLFSFMPIVGWRLTAGHLDLLLGTSLFWVLVCVLLAVQERTLTISLFLVSLTFLLNTIPSHGVQSEVYSLFFGAAILLPLAVSRGKFLETFARKEFGAAVLLGIGALGLSLPKLWGMVQHINGSDSSRSLNGDSILFSYTTATLQDWLTSMPWTKDIFDLGRDLGYQHETNYPMGPLILCLLLFPWLRRPALGLGVVLCGLLAMSFSADIDPVTSIMTRIFPVLDHFRVPARSVIPFVMTLPILGSALLLPHLKKAQGKLEWLLVAASCGIYFIPGTAREIFSWALVLGLIGFIMMKIKLSFVSKEFVLIALALSCISSFKERLGPFMEPSLAMSSADSFHSAILQAKPQLASPLSRARVKFNFEPFTVNSALIMDISSLEGYWNPPNRFLKLYSSLNRIPYHPIRMVFRPNEEQSFQVLQQLYNVGVDVEFVMNKLAVKDLPPSLGQAWFSEKVKKVSSADQVATELLNQGPHLSSFLQQNALIDAEDSEVAKIQFPSSETGACAHALVSDIKVQKYPASMDLKVSTPDSCPLALATNFVTSFSAVGKTKAGVWQPLGLYPVYGALTGLIVPSDVTEIRIETQAVQPPWLGFAFYLGLFCIFAGLFLLIRAQKITS
jgi:hypothetical protein